MLPIVRMLQSQFDKSPEAKEESKYPCQRLYERSKERQTKAYQKGKEKVYNEEAQLKNFKVTNKHSLFLNSQDKKKPNYCRVKEIIEERENFIVRKRMEKSKALDEK